MNKKGVSLIISYVLLLVMTISMAAMVYGWLKYQAKLPEEIKCPEGIGLPFIYTCNQTHMNLTVINKGLHAVDGYRYLFYYDDGSTDYSITSISHFNPGDVNKTIIPLNLDGRTKVVKLSILPFRTETKGLQKRTVFCTNAMTTTDIENCPP